MRFFLWKIRIPPTSVEICPKNVRFHLHNIRCILCEIWILKIGSENQRGLGDEFVRLCVMTTSCNLGDDLVRPWWRLRVTFVTTSCDFRDDFVWLSWRPRATLVTYLVRPVLLNWPCVSIFPEISSRRLHQRRHFFVTFSALFRHFVGTQKKIDHVSGT